MYEFKIYRGVMCHDHEEWCKIWKGMGFPFQNWHEEFEGFWPDHSKICTLMGSFWPKYIMFELKMYRRAMFDGAEDWCKIEGKLTLFSKMKSGIWQVFTDWKIAISF